MNWHSQIDSAWNSRETRKRFENATGFSSLDVPQSEFRKVVDSGYYGLYVDAFNLWATKDLGIADISPRSIKEALNPTTSEGE